MNFKDLEKKANVAAKEAADSSTTTAVLTKVAANLATQLAEAAVQKAQDAKRIAIAAEKLEKDNEDYMRD